jgi:serine phosphatase RsbU (regulator of sigma subunit)
VSLRIGFASIAAFILLNNVGFLTQVTEAIGLLVFLCCLGDVVVHRVLGDQKQLVGYRQELETARSIQANILPKAIPRTKGLEIAVRYVPMSEVAGDFYDFLPVNERAVGILVADVSGHGVPAALIASMVKVAFSAQEERSKDASQVISDMNRILCGKMKSQFVTAGYIYVDPHEDNLIYSTAGHPPLLIWRKAQRMVQEIRLNGMLMGHVPDAKYVDTKIDIEPGDRIVLYTDGIVEATNADGEFFEKQRLVGLLESGSDLDVEAFADHLLFRLATWTGRELEGEAFEDDLTFVIADIKET